MSDSVNQWIDAEQLRQLANSLLTPVPKRSAPPAEVAYGSEFVGYMEADDHGQPTVASEQGTGQRDAERFLAQARGVATGSGMLAQAEPVQAPPSAEVETSPVQETRELPGSTAVEVPPVPEAPPADPMPEAEQMTEAQFEIPEEAREQAPAQPIESPFRIQENPVAPATVAQPAAVPPAAQAAQQPTPATPPVPVQAGPTPMPQVAELVAAGTPLPHRLKAFGEWLKSVAGVQAFFISDRNGDLLTDEIGNPKLVKVARTLAHASSSASRQTGDEGLGSMHVRIGAEAVLEVIPIRSRYGLMVLGVIRSQPLGRAGVSVVGYSLSQILGDQLPAIQ